MTALLKAAGPVIGVASDPEIDAGYETIGLVALRPHFADYSNKTLPARDEFVPPEHISVQDPDTISLIHETPVQVDPAYFFQAFVTGAVMVAGMVPTEYIEPIQIALRDELAVEISQGGGLPAIDRDFAASYRRGEIAVFRNGESVSWGNLLAFAYGAYWLLSYVEKPRRKRRSQSPLDYVEQTVLHYAGLAHLPIN